MSSQWDAVWDRKGHAETNDPFEISGFENFRDVDTQAAAEKLIELLNIQQSDSVLEIGCGGGLLARHLLARCNYVGTDRSCAIVNKMIEINKCSALRCDANDLIFKDKSFDHVFAFTVFHYFPDHSYAHQCLAEMTRVARKSVCVSDLPIESHDPTHLLFEESFFKGWQIGRSLYPREHKRFTAVLTL